MTKRILFILTLFFTVLDFQAQASTVDTDAAVPSLSMIQHVEHWYKENMNYFSITFLMACESSILPVPSEIVIPPAVYVSMNPGSDMSILMIIVFGTLGALIGASFNYWMSLWLGRLVIYKFADSKAGRILMLSSEKIRKSEKFFNDHGKTSTFIGRLIPVVRHLISIPAGLAKMNYFSFLLYTTLGAGLWNCILALMGYYAHDNQAMINQYSHEISYVFVVIGFLLLGALVYKMRKKKS
jgi:membrane protein DedA with SNARE-associated domain